MQRSPELEVLLCALKAAVAVRLYEPQETRPKEKTPYSIAVKTNDLPPVVLTAR